VDARQRALDKLLELGEARLPHRPVTREAFVARVTAAVGDADLETIHAADLYLACALAIVDERAIAVAERELMPVVRQSAGKIDANPMFVDEATQRVRSKLLVGEGGGAPGIASYRGTGPLARWVRVVATRVAVDLKRVGVKDTDDEGLDQLPAPDDPELALIWQTSADEYRRALASAFETLTRRERTLLRQRYIDNLDIAALGRLHRVNPSTTFRWLRQIEEKLADATRSLLVTRLALSESQLHSMERMVASQLQISLARMLRGGR
jgi:RNA polymerase sigma-70 factor (ECF subfamily)